MKKLSNLLAALVFVSLVIFISCSSDSGTDPTNPLDDQAALLNGTWTASNIGYITGLPDDIWLAPNPTFQLTISNATSAGGNFTTNAPTGYEAVWSDGSWTFNNTTGSQLLRTSDQIVISVSNLTETSATLSFTVPNGRAESGIPGAWTFTMTK